MTHRTRLHTPKGPMPRPNAPSPPPYPQGTDAPVAYTGYAPLPPGYRRLDKMYQKHFPTPKELTRLQDALGPPP